MPCRYFERGEAMTIKRFKILNQELVRTGTPIEPESSLTLAVAPTGPRLFPATTLTFTVTAVVKDWSPSFIRLEGYQAEGEQTHGVVGYMRVRPPFEDSIGLLELHLDED